LRVLRGIPLRLVVSAGLQSGSVQTSPMFTTHGSR